MKLAVILSCILATASLCGQSFNQVEVSAKADLDKALTKLKAVKSQIVQQRTPLANEESALKDDALRLRTELENILRRRDNTDRDLRSLENEVEARKDENAYITSLMGEYIRAFENRLDISEKQVYQEMVDNAKLTTEDINLSAAEKFEIQLELINTALDRMDNLIGGNQFQGLGVLPGGKLKEGTYTQLGPIVFFSSEEEKVAGLARREFGSSQPSVVSLGDSDKKIAAFTAAGGKGEVPLDPTLGNAFQIEEIKESVIEIIQKGGLVMIPILTFAGIALLIAIFKWFEISSIRRARPKDLAFILDCLNSNRPDEALQYAQRLSGPVGEMLTTAVQNYDKDKEHIEELLYEKLIKTQPKLERLLPFVALAAALAPLLGLLGTVTGMIKTFKLITIFGTGDAKSLSSGISEALITTEFGLIVAIPSLILHALLSRKSKGVLASLERTAIGFINGLPGRRN